MSKVLVRESDRIFNGREVGVVAAGRTSTGQGGRTSTGHWSGWSDIDMSGWSDVNSLEVERSEVERSRVLEVKVPRCQQVGGREAGVESSRQKSDLRTRRIVERSGWSDVERSGWLDVERLEVENSGSVKTWSEVDVLRGRRSSFGVKFSASTIVGCDLRPLDLLASWHLAASTFNLSGRRQVSGWSEVKCQKDLVSRTMAECRGVGCS